MVFRLMSDYEVTLVNDNSECCAIRTSSLDADYHLVYDFSLLDIST